MRKFKYILFLLVCSLFFIPKEAFALSYNDISITFYFSNGSNASCNNVKQCNVSSVNTPVNRVSVRNNSYTLLKDSKYELATTLKLYLDRNTLGSTNQFYTGNLAGNKWNGASTVTWNNIDKVESGSQYGSTYAITWGLVQQFTSVITSDGMTFDFYFSSPTNIKALYVERYELFNLGNTTNDAINSSTNTIINNNNTNTDKIIESNKKTQEKLDTAETTRKGILQQILDLPGKFLDMLKSLFIPGDDYFSDKFNELLDNVTSRLGILGYPFVLVLDTLEFFLTIEDTGNYVITWPNITVPNFESNIIIPAGSFDFSSLLSISSVSFLHNLYFVFINALLILSFLKLCNNTYARMFGGDIDETEYLTVSEENRFDSNGELVGSKVRKSYTLRRSS